MPSEFQNFRDDQKKIAALNDNKKNRNNEREMVKLTLNSSKGIATTSSRRRERSLAGEGDRERTKKRRAKRKKRTGTKGQSKKTGTSRGGFVSYARRERFYVRGLSESRCSVGRQSSVYIHKQTFHSRRAGWITGRSVHVVGSSSSSRKKGKQFCESVGLAVPRDAFNGLSSHEPRNGKGGGVGENGNPDEPCRLSFWMCSSSSREPRASQHCIFNALSSQRSLSSMFFAIFRAFNSQISSRCFGNFILVAERERRVQIENFRVNRRVFFLVESTIVPRKCREINRLRKHARTYCQLLRHLVEI